MLETKKIDGNKKLPGLDLSAYSKLIRNMTVEKWVTGFIKKKNRSVLLEGDSYSRRLLFSTSNKIIQDMYFDVE